MNKVFTIHNVLISFDGEYEQFCVIIIGQKLVMEAKVSSKNSYWLLATNLFMQKSNNTSLNNYSLAIHSEQK